MPVPQSRWPWLQIVRIFRSFSEDFSFHKPVSLISLLFVPLSRIAYVPAPPSSLPGGGFGITGSATCAPFLTEKGWRRGRGGVAAGTGVPSTSGLLRLNLFVTLTYYSNVISLHCIIIDKVISYFEMCDSYYTIHLDYISHFYASTCCEFGIWTKHSPEIFAVRLSFLKKTLQVVYAVYLSL